MTEVLFWIFGVMTLASAVMAVTRKNAVAAAIWLVAMFFGLAANFVLLEAYFVAVVQVLVYAGAIMVLFLFVIMLMDLRTETLEQEPAPRFPALGVGAALFFLVVAMLTVYQTAQDGLFVQASAGADLDGGAGAIGERLFGTWLLAFEVTSVLLLGGILGAVILTKRRLS